MDKSLLPSKCHSCESKLGTPVFCAGCQSLQPVPQAVDYFELLGLPRTWSLDEQKLRQAYRNITRNVHPDRFSDQPSEVRALSIRLAAEVNAAMTVLRDPVRRASYLLERAGGPASSEERGVPGNLLGEVMMLREEIEEATEAADAAALESIRAGIAQRCERSLARAGEMANRLDDATDEQKRELRLLLNAVRYFENLLAELPADPFQGQAEVNDAS